MKEKRRHYECNWITEKGRKSFPKIRTSNIDIEIDKHADKELSRLKKLSGVSCLDFSISLLYSDACVYTLNIYLPQLRRHRHLVILFRLLC